MKSNTKTKTILAMLPLLALATSAPAALVTGWTMTFDGNSDGSISNTATANPVQNEEKTSIEAGFSAITLADGDSVSLSGSVSFSGADLGTQFRWGLFNSASDDGYYVEGALSGSNGVLSHSTVSSPHRFGTTGSTDFSVSPSAPTEATVADVPYAFFLTLTRNGSEIDVVTSLTGNSGGYSSTTSTSTSIDSITPEFTFDEVSFLLGGGAPVGVVATYSNVDVTYTAVPEPSSAVLLGLGGFALILRRRK